MKSKYYINESKHKENITNFVYSIITHSISSVQLENSYDVETTDESMFENVNRCYRRVVENCNNSKDRLSESDLDEIINIVYHCNLSNKEDKRLDDATDKKIHERFNHTKHLMLKNRDYIKDTFECRTYNNQ
tara:strand:- start:10 stop:405 length:396 start_codon:yes stop_codon:yes gene_type:complete